MRIPEYNSRKEMRLELHLFRDHENGSKIPVKRPVQSDAVELAKKLFSWTIADDFRFVVIGSFPHLPEIAKDVDLLLVRREGRKLNTKRLEEAMIAIQYFGLKGLGIFVDTSFINLSEEQVAEKNLRLLPYVTWRLESPRHHEELNAGAPPWKIKTAGRFLSMKRSMIMERRYYRKLPIDRVSGRRYLRKTVPLEAYL